jgi:hypothetical protein
VTAAAHGYLQAERACEGNGVGDVGHASALGNHSGTLVDEPIVKSSRFVVLRIIRAEDVSSERGRQFNQVGR